MGTIAKIASEKSTRRVYRRERNLYEAIFLDTQMNRLTTGALFKKKTREAAFAAQ